MGGVFLCIAVHLTNITGKQVPDVSSAASPPRKDIEYQSIEAGDQVGAGGQAVVYEATLSGSSNPERVALEEPQTQGRMLGEDTVETFLSEAETWATVDERERRKSRWWDSEHIVGVVSVGDQLPWIVMEGLV